MAWMKSMRKRPEEHNKAWKDEDEHRVDGKLGELVVVVGGKSFV